MDTKQEDKEAGKEKQVAIWVNKETGDIVYIHGDGVEQFIPYGLHQNWKRLIHDPKTKTMRPEE